jgi:hypothetical protein
MVFADGFRKQVSPLDPQSMAARFEAGALDGVLSPILREPQRYQQDPTKVQVLLKFRTLDSSFKVRRRK